MITRVGVVGSGVMGSGIAAQFANAGIPIELLDVPSPGPRRSETAERALIDARRRKPPPFMTDSAATLVRPGNTEDDLDRLAGCDWIVEAVVEDVGVKRELFRAIESVRRYGSVVSSNTSTIPRAELLAGAPPTLSPDFVIAHFFNPPRYLRLLELVAGQETRPEAIAVVAKTADVALGKSVVCCNDTPGFVANRIGLAWMNAVLKETVVRQLRVEDADAIASMAFGVPKTGVFGLFDLVGIDLALLVERSFRERLPASDPLRLIDPPVGLLETMAADGRTGRKGGGGFYRLERIDGQDVELALDIGSGEYRPVARPPRSIHSPGGLRTLVEADDEVGRFAWATLSFVLSYAASLVPEVCDAAAPIDLAMETGYGWRCGPFRLLDELGAADVANRLAADGQPVPPFLERAAAAGVFYETVDGVERALTIDSAPRPIVRPNGVELLADLKRRTRPLVENESAALWEVGDDVLCVEFTAKANVIDLPALALLEESVEQCVRYRALIIYNEGDHFSHGASIPFMLALARARDWEALDAYARAGQRAFAALRAAPAPVVGAPSGRALGGGCELLLHCDAIEAHAETYLGLVETRVGIIPGWGGCKEVLSRMSERSPYGPMAPVRATFDYIRSACVSTSAAEAREIGLLRATDGITFNRARLLAAAKQRALALADGYAPPPPRVSVLPGASGRAALRLSAHALALAGRASAHDVVVLEALANVLCGGNEAGPNEMTEEQLFELERDAVLKLLHTDETVARLSRALAPHA